MNAGFSTVAALFSTNTIQLTAMRSYHIESYIKSLDELPDRLTDNAPEPKTGPNDVVVDVYCAALNFFDILQLQGKYQNQPPFPWNAGAEFAGVISPSSPIPKGCNFVPGKTRVFGASQGAYAERIAADWTKLVIVPDDMSLAAASSLFVTYPTSYAGLVTRAKLQKGEWCLIHAAAGGVGLVAVHLAKALGAKVIATAGSEAKLKVCKDNGADYVLDYTDKNWPTKVKEITGGKGADVIYDPVGMILPSLKCIAWNGRAVVVGFAAGSIEKIPMNLVLLKNISIVGIHWGAYTKNEPEHIPEVWAALLQLLREGALRPVIFDKVYEGLESVPEGLKDLGSRKTWGKAVIRIKAESNDATRQSKL